MHLLHGQLDEMKATRRRKQECLHVGPKGPANCVGGNTAQHLIALIAPVLMARQTVEGPQVHRLAGTGPCDKWPCP